MLLNESVEAVPSSPPSGPSASSPTGGLERILDIQLELRVELGHKRLKIAELLALEVGTVVDLGTAAGSPLSVYANDVLIAQGEAVLVGERYGVRITDIVPSSERVRRLGGKAGAR